ncbi:MAG: FAD-dependent oxidoreductase [Hyphomonadaceae bacterium]|nr:FAD-dependent oxidoreductase [Hyphomonadaceae bacterium]
MRTVRSRYRRPTFGYVPHADQFKSHCAHHAVVIAGAGLVGLTLAIDLKLKGVPVVVLERGETVSEGSRSICQAKRTLEIWDRLGAAAPMVEHGVTWNIGKVFLGDSLLYQFDLLPEAGHKMPAFVNLQQYYVDECLLRRFIELGGDVRWRHALERIDHHDDHVVVHAVTPEGPYSLTCDWLVSAEGARSTVRQQLGLKFDGQLFEDKFLITDVHMKADFPSERWFWFNPPFHDGQTALLHRQADDIWRIDLQLGWDADVEREKNPDRVAERIERMLGPGVDFDLDWISVYVFQCRTLESYVHGRVIFVGDAAHQVSPFGARGGNAGVQDADNLAWKLNLVLDGKAPASLLETYSHERLYAARENILNSTRSTDFITPKTAASRAMRDAALDLARTHDFARALVNPGRLSTPAHLKDSVLNTPDEDVFATSIGPGSPALDAPIRIRAKSGWLIDLLSGEFALLYYGEESDVARTLAAAELSLKVIAIGREVKDAEGLVAHRYDLKPGSAYLFRPDQHIAARWRAPDAAKIAAAQARACGRI